MIGEKSMTEENKLPEPSCPNMSEDDGVIVAPPCSICDEDEAVIECSGAMPHGFCAGCFQGYARVSFELNGEYERVRNRDGLESKAGTLPCPHFIQGACTCTEMHPSLLRRFVNDDTFDMWRRADVRLGMATIVREQQNAEMQRQAAEEQQTPLGTLRHAVHEALTKGGTVCCPLCKAKGEKDDQCMHIKCVSCNTEWCYCCGRPRGSNGSRELCSRHNGCDAVSAYLESQPGWGAFALRGETPGQGALHEFHRRRIAFFLKQLKLSTEAELWAELRANNPDLLNDIPTEGRNIEWDSIDTADIPTFGETRPVDVRWADEGHEIVSDFALRRREALENQEVVELQSNRKTILQRRFAEFLANGVSRSSWICMTFNFLVLFGLLCSSVTVQNEIAKFSLVASLCLYSSIVLTRGVSLAIDSRYSILLGHEDEWVLPYAEVQFCGSRDEFPYLSGLGRWRKFRLFYLFVLFNSLCFGISMTVVFESWSHARCISLKGICGLGPALLAFATMLFGGGSILLNLSPPPSVTAIRYLTYKRTMCQLFVLGAYLVPAGVYLMAGYADDNRFPPLWVVGSVILGITSTIILATLSHRCVNPRGFALDRGELISNKWHVLFWGMVMLGGFMLGTSELGDARFVIGCVLGLCPVLFVLLAKVWSTV